MDYFSNSVSSNGMRHKLHGLQVGIYHWFSLEGDFSRVHGWCSSHSFNATTERVARNYPLHKQDANNPCIIFRFPAQRWSMKKLLLLILQLWVNKSMEKEKIFINCTNWLSNIILISVFLCSGLGKPLLWAFVSSPSC